MDGKFGLWGNNENSNHKMDMTVIIVISMLTTFWGGIGFFWIIRFSGFCWTIISLLTFVLRNDFGLTGAELEFRGFDLSGSDSSVQGRYGLEGFCLFNTASGFLFGSTFLSFGGVRESRGFSERVSILWRVGLLPNSCFLFESLLLLGSKTPTPINNIHQYSTKELNTKTRKMNEA